MSLEYLTEQRIKHNLISGTLELLQETFDPIRKHRYPQDTDGVPDTFTKWPRGTLRRSAQQKHHPNLEELNNGGNIWLVPPIYDARKAHTDPQAPHNVPH